MKSMFLFRFRLLVEVATVTWLLQVLPTNAFTVLKPCSLVRTTRNPWQQQQHRVASFLQASSSTTTTAAANREEGTPPPQVLTFEEPNTNVTVVLVGSMHYNPASIQLACDTITEFAENNELGSVVIEACDVRWNNTQELHDQQPILKKVLENEMRASAQVSHDFNRPVVLGDQRINVTTTRLKSAFSETLRDLITLNWTNLYKDLTKAVEVALPSGPGYMDASGFIDLRLLLAAPVSLVKYPLSYIVRAPIASIVVLSVLLALELPTAAETGDSSMLSMTWQDWVGSVAFAVLEIIVFLRMFVNVLLAERNEVLARSILRQCQIYSGENDKVQTNWWSRKFSSWFRPKAVRAAAETVLDDDDDDIIYAPVPDDKDSVVVDASVVGMSNTRSSTAPPVSNKKDNGKKVVVAVMGMAHCNGVKKLLEENLVQ